MASNSILKFIGTDSTDHVEYECGPGLCVMINNMEFEDTKLKSLLGGRKDEKVLTSAFTSLGFKVKVHQNLTAAEMKSTVEGYSQLHHTGAFFLVISSHGGKGDVVYGTDDHDKGTVAVHDDLVKHFTCTNCPSLAGIPKVFVIDACRGTGYEDDGNTNNATMPKSEASSNPHMAINTKPLGLVDTMAIFASTRGKVANCDINEGSIFIQVFTEVLKSRSTKMNLTDIMKKVQRVIQHYQLQIPQYESSFSKDYYIARHKHTSGLEERVEQARQDMKELSVQN